MLADRTFYYPITLERVQSVLKRLKLVATNYSTGRREDHRHVAWFVVPGQFDKDAELNLRMTLFRMPEMLWADLKQQDDGIHVEIIGKDRVFDIKVISGLLKKAKVDYSISRTTRVPGYHTITNGFKPYSHQSDGDTFVFIGYFGKTGYNGRDEDWTKVRAELDTAGLVHEDRDDGIRVYGFRPEPT